MSIIAEVNNVECKQLFQTQMSGPTAQHPTHWYLEICILSAADQDSQEAAP